MTATQKTEIRAELKKVLASIDHRWLEAASHEVCKHLQSFLDTEIGQEIHTILAWVKAFPGEVDLSALVSEEVTRRKIYLPRMSADKTLTFIEVGQEWLQEVEKGPLGILEPRHSHGDIFTPTLAKGTLALVPGLAFDEQGGRLGRGSGYYDRFLSQPGMEEVIRVGICWTLQMVTKVPCLKHDVRMQWVCHEEGIKTCL